MCARGLSLRFLWFLSRSEGSGAHIGSGVRVVRERQIDRCIAPLPASECTSGGRESARRPSSHTQKRMGAIYCDRKVSSGHGCVVS